MYVDIYFAIWYYTVIQNDEVSAMKRELGIARCGLACCLCSGNNSYSGCNSGECPDKELKNTVLEFFKF